ncbi:U6 snRNA phosphodiesterase isoform X1 [Phoenix dactylifera]|uniref:U6 snRNA phosphodiesterase n=2 Tax=Phoenix dactylifera TaxID=42345 RepID=A0A8B7C9Y9_PHODC|nr:U6 snRNA phosphodiesterase isoform X1 [Phoenix dactylifera]
MEALRATYGSDSESDDESSPPRSSGYADSRQISNPKGSEGLPPPPPLDLLQPPNFLDVSSTTKGSRIRSFPHVEGNYALHVYVPVSIPSTTRKQLAYFVKIIESHVPGLYAADVDYALSELCKDDQKLEQILLGREFHISLGRTVPIQVHQIDSIVAMLRENFKSQRRYWIEFNKWEVFVNDDRTRTFLSLEVLRGGLPEITKQIHIIDDIYRLHGLPEFYKNPRPHISLVWALGDISNRLKQAVEEFDRSRGNSNSLQKDIFMCKFTGIECRIGKKTYNICKFLD